MPFDRAERNIQFYGNICLFAVLEIVCNHNSSLQLRKISNLGLETMERFCIIIDVDIRIRIRYQLCNLINGNANHAFRGIAVIVTERIMGNSPYELPHICNTIFNKKSAERSYRNFLRQILCVVNAFAPH